MYTCTRTPPCETPHTHPVCILQGGVSTTEWQRPSAPCLHVGVAALVLRQVVLDLGGPLQLAGLVAADARLYPDGGCPLRFPLHTHARTHARTHTRTHARTHARTHTQMHARTHARTRTHRDTRTHRERETDTHTQTHTRTDTQTHTDMSLPVRHAIHLRRVSYREGCPYCISHTPPGAVPATPSLDSDRSLLMLLLVRLGLGLCRERFPGETRHAGTVRRGTLAHRARVRARVRARARALGGWR
jgi:carbohydrate-binding DOMON domain-containing protein